ncbi:MAG: hypothetical protein E7464_01170 [Ruminococcaceae bacterium]|nr:hypothetical protein [Oscillospiraceae bacterium]
MEKFIPYEKLSKKERRKLNLAARRTWGICNPVTRKPANSRAYNRKKSQDWKRDLPPKHSCDFLLYSARFCALLDSLIC